jgi:prephenate dehydrogenase
MQKTISSISNKDASKELSFGIIGGRGKLGSFFSNILREGGYNVQISDLGTKTTTEDIITRCNIIILSVPISVSSEVAAQIAPLVKPDQLIVDVTSVKRDVVEALQKGSSEILAIHPMFAPTLPSAHGQLVISCRVRPSKYSQVMEDLLSNAGLRVLHSTVEEHDKMMAIIQGLTHFNAIALSHTLKALNASVERTLQFSSPVYRIALDMAGRVLAQNSELYADIALSNADVPRVIQSYLKSAAELLTYIENKNKEGYRKFFEAGQKHLGTFADDALKESDYLISQLLSHLVKK